MKILLAEDDQLLRKSLAYFLTNSGYTITEITNGVDAVEALRKEEFDLIITDLNMPYVGGMEIINVVRNELHRSTPIIMLTSSGIETTELEAFSLGASEFVSKPFSPVVLKMRIDKLLNRPTNP